MVDLNLASSYVPAFVCVTKSLLLSVLALFLLPMGGLSPLCTLVLLDRVFLNSDFILDVNAAASSVLWAYVANHERNHFGISTPASMVICGLWAVMASLQLAQPGTCKPKTELYAYAALMFFISATHFPIEPLPLCIARTMGYQISVLVQVYWQLSTSQDERLVLTLLRHASVLVAPPFIALAAFLAPNFIVAMRWKPQPQEVKEDPDVEAAALREALASRKEKAGN